MNLEVMAGNVFSTMSKSLEDHRQIHFSIIPLTPNHLGFSKVKGIVFVFVFNIYIHIVIHRQICFVLSELISVARQYLPVAGIETRLTQTPSQSF